jgi:hypothetical protein
MSENSAQSWAVVLEMLKLPDLLQEIWEII